MELELAEKIQQEDQSKNHSDSSSENEVVSDRIEIANIDVAPRIQESSSSDDSSSSDEETEQQDKLSASTISKNHNQSVSSATNHSIGPQPHRDESDSEEETKQAEPTTQTFEYQQSEHVENESISESSDDE